MRYLKDVLIFLILFFVGQAILAFVLSSVLEKSQFRFSKLYKGEMANEVVCLGNSRGVNSFYVPYINENYKSKAFNLSYNGLNIYLMQTILEDYLEENQKPEKVYIEVSIAFNKIEKGYKSFKLYAGNSNRISKAIKEDDQFFYNICNLFPLFRFNSELFYRSLFYLNKTDQTWINRYKISSDLNQKVAAMEPIEFTVDEGNIRIMREAIDLLRANDIEVVLFLAPYLPTYKPKIKNLDAIIQKIEEGVDAKIVDLSSSLENIDYFADRVHTNENGAKKIVELLFDPSFD